jgi:transketolase
VVVEAGVDMGWHKYAGSYGVILGLDRFGVSAPCRDVMNHFGFTADAVMEAGRRALA